MNRPLRVGVLGLTHDHVWENIDALVRHECTTLVAAADSRPELRDRVRAYGCDQLYELPEQLLDSEDVDAVYIYSDNRRSAELAVQAAQRGLHVMVEKPLAADYVGAVRAVAAAHTANTQLMVNWPFIWWSSLQYALQLITEGRIGRVFQVHYRTAHAGPREVGCSPAFSDWLLDPHLNGSGVLMDYCSYGVALTCLLLGQPSRVTGITSRVKKIELQAEDNAVIVMQHAAALSTSIGSWTQIGHMTSYIPMFYGTDGTLIVEHDSVVLATTANDSGESLSIPAPTSQRISSAAFFAHHIRSGEPISGICSAAVSLATQEVLEAALASARIGQAVSLPLPTTALEEGTRLNF